jgi:hypothetical protein
MQNATTTHREGGAVRVTRLLIGISALIALTLAVAASSASATTVYDYVYSGTYFDGSGAGKTFDERISGLEYDSVHNVFYVADGNIPGEFGTLGTITKITPAGTGVNFPATGTPQIMSTPRTDCCLEYHLTYEFVNPQVSVDQTGGPNEGNIYASGSGRIYGWDPNGNPLPGFEQEMSETGLGIAVLPNGEIYTNGPGRGNMGHFNSKGTLLKTYMQGSPGLEPSVNAKWSERGALERIAVDNEGDVYGIKFGNGFFEPKGDGRLIKTDDEAKQIYEVNEYDAFGQHTTGVAVDHSNDNVFAVREPGTFEEYDSKGRLLGGGWGGPDPGHSYLGLSANPNPAPMGIAVDPATHDVWIANRRNYSGARRIEKFEAVNPHIIPQSTALAPDYSDPSGNTIVLQGEIDPDGTPTTDCHFEYGTEEGKLNKTLPCTQGPILASKTKVTTAPIAVKHGIRYWYKVSSKNANNQVARSNTQNFIPQAKPIVGTTVADRISTDGARMTTELNPNGGNASVHFEYGVKGGPLDQSTPETDTVGFNTENENFGSTSKYEPGIYQKSNLVTGLTPDTIYEYKAVVTNEAGSVSSPIGEFRTYPPDSGTDPCANALVRKQTGSALLLDCRAYELASAANAGGFDVQSDIVPGLAPLDAYPRATDSLLYSLHFGVVPGISGSPTNLGLDPYIARRGETGWSTEYVGLPADEMADEGAFGSPLLAADPSLHEFAFGGQDICDPCYADGSTNIPLRLSNGELVKGMAGSSNPAGNPSGRVAKPFSADGTHFVFGSTAEFESAGDAGGSIYDRNLSSNTTQVVSTMPVTGATITGGEVGELDISSDGSRIVVGQRISTVAGNEYWHLYMHIGTTAASADLTPGATAGALFDGMSADGSRVFFTTRDKLLGTDTDSMADIYEASVSGGGTVSLRLITTKGGTASNDESCTPAGKPESWNAVSGNGKCDAVAFAGGAGVASDGTFYFVSPEQLDGGEGEQNQVNLYIVEPGQNPDFVETIDSTVGKAAPAPINHPVASATRVTGLSSPESISVDQTAGPHGGDIYVFERSGGGKVSRYTAAGAADNFSALPGPTNKVTGLTNFGTSTVEVAVDSSPSPFKEYFYATHFFEIDVFAPTGEKMGSIGGLTLPCGVAVEQSTGNVYVSDAEAHTIWRFAPINATPPVTAANYVKTGLKTEGESFNCQLAVDNAGNVYQNGYPGGPVNRYNASDFLPVPVEKPGTVVGGESVLAINTDPANNDLYINTGSEIERYDASGKLIQKFGSGSLAASKGVAVDATTKHVFAPVGANIVDFGTEEVPYHPIDQPGAIDGVKQNGVHSFRDFQVSPDGRYAAFSTKSPITGYPTFGHSHIYRYDAEEEEMDCASCSVTGGATSEDTFLSPSGLNMADDGRVFYTTKESLTLRDTNEKTDVYEWELPPAGPPVGACEAATGCIRLISTGIGPDNSGLVTVGADGRDAFFFTRDVLTHEDENGNAVKVYDAREGGGFLHDPARKQCAASDECHGPGTETPPPPVINTITGSGKEQKQEKPCKKGFVKKNGKCVKKKRKHRHHNRKSSHSHG